MDSNDQSNELRSEEAFAELLGKASPRALPPKVLEAEIRQAIHAEWQTVVRRNSRVRQVTSFALAASVLLAVFASLSLLRTPLPDFQSQQLATIERQFGDVQIATQGPSSPTQVASIEGGDVVETGSESGFALGWHDGGTLRLDENTVVVFEAANQVYLQQGRVYFDSVNSGALQAQQDAKDFLIRTDDGLVQHIGTQYMTEVTSTGTTVSVREGRVTVAGNHGNRRASQGEQLIIAGSGEFTVAEISGFGEHWRWVQKTTPPIDLHGRPVSQALNWVSRESGLTVVFDSETAAHLAASTELRGLQGQLDVEPVRALEIFMLTVDLDAHIEGGNIIVSEAL